MMVGGDLPTMFQYLQTYWKRAVGETVPEAEAGAS